MAKKLSIVQKIVKHIQSVDPKEHADALNKLLEKLKPNIIFSMQDDFGPVPVIMHLFEDGTALVISEHQLGFFEKEHVMAALAARCMPQFLKAAGFSPDQYEETGEPLNLREEQKPIEDGMPVRPVDPTKH